MDHGGDTMTGDSELERLEGVVVSEVWAEGSKSEHEGLQLDIGDRRWLLRRQGANPFEDEVLAPLAGHRVAVTGRPHGTVFFVESWELLDDDGGDDVPSGDDGDSV